MSDPRDVRLLRVVSLRSAQRAVALLGCHADPVRAVQSVVLVPSRAAAEELRRTLERYRLDRTWHPSPETFLRLGVASPSCGPDAGSSLPRLLTRAEWYAAMQEAAMRGTRMLSAVERETLLAAAAHDAAAGGHPPPFRLAPGLIAEMIDFYDALQRNLRGVDDFDRLLTGTLEPSVELDRGAARMLQQTRFLAESFRRFEAQCRALGAFDEHGLRARLCRAAGPAGIAQLIVTLPDQAADPEGLWPADFDLMARLPGLGRIDVIATEAQLATGLLERLHDRLPGLVDCRPDLDSDIPPRLLVPGGGQAAHFTSRDREDELADALGRLVSHARSTEASDPGGVAARFGRCGLVYQRPLPYLHLARHLFESAGLAYEAIDSLPLAAEPYVAAFDLVLSFVASGYTRAATVAMLGSPHLLFTADGTEVTRRQVGALDAELARLDYLGGREQLDTVSRLLTHTECGPAASAAAATARELESLRTGGAASALLSALIDFLDRHDRAPALGDVLADRRSQARGTLLDTLCALRDAEVRFGDRPTEMNALGSTIRRWIEGQTFAPRTGRGGLRLTDARAAAYGDFDAVHLLGLVEGEWPAPPARNIFFPAGLLRELGWTPESDRVAFARAAFADLVRLARGVTSASTFALEDDAIVRPAAFLEELAEAELERVPAHDVGGRLHAAGGEPSGADTWARLRSSRPHAENPRFHGFAGPRVHQRYSVTAIETYLACPFKYFAGRELGLEEESETAGTLSPLEHGRIVHEVLERFFASWAPDAGTHRSPGQWQAAREHFRGIVQASLASLPEGERQLEWRRFMGTAVTVGICDRVLMAEALLGGVVVERLLEHDLAGEYPVAGSDPPVTRVVRGKADRLDLLDGGYLRVLDYKSGKAPPLGRSLQLPVYAACAERELAGRRGRAWTTAEAAYVPLAGPRMLVPVIAEVGTRDAAVARAERLVSQVLEGIETGRFPPRPADVRLCATCGFAAVCRKDYVDVDST